MNDDTLISLVQTNDMLYNKLNRQYKDGKCKKEIWEQIGLTLGASVEDVVTLNGNEKDMELMKAKMEMRLAKKKSDKKEKKNKQNDTDAEKDDKVKQ